MVSRTETPFNPIDGPIAAHRWPSQLFPMGIDGHRWDLNYRPAHGGSCGAFLG